MTMNDYNNHSMNYNPPSPYIPSSSSINNNNNTTDVSSNNTNNTSTVDSSFFNFKVTESFGEDAAWALNDVMRMLAIQFTVQALMYFNDPNSRSFFTGEFVLMTLYVVLGVLVYWLIIRRIIQWS